VLREIVKTGNSCYLVFNLLHNEKLDGRLILRLRHLLTLIHVSQVFVSLRAPVRALLLLASLLLLKVFDDFFMLMHHLEGSLL